MENSFTHPRPRWPAGLAVLAVLAAVQPAAAEPRFTVSLRMSDQLSATGFAQRPSAPVAAAERVAAMTPSAREYRIGAEDLLEIQVFGVDELTRTVRVNSRGFVSLPLIGTLALGGLTAQQAEALVVAKLAASYLQDPQVSLFIKEYTSQRVTVEGAVQKPGVYPLRGPTSLLQTLALAGGQGGLSDMSEVMLFRAGAEGRETLTFDVDRIRAGELEDPAVANDDLIVVKRSRARTLLKDSVLRDVIDAVNPFR